MFFKDKNVNHVFVSVTSLLGLLSKMFRSIYVSMNDRDVFFVLIV